MTTSDRPPGSERRQYERLELWFPVTLDVAGREIWSICRDLSRTGIQVSARQRVPVGTPITVRFRVSPHDTTERVAEGKVVRCEDNETELGLVFPARVAVRFDEAQPPFGEEIERAVPSAR
jgi:hypothetical protein